MPALGTCIQRDPSPVAHWSCRGISRVQGELPALEALAEPWVPVLGRQQDVGALRLSRGCLSWAGSRMLVP